MDSVANPHLYDDPGAIIALPVSSNASEKATETTHAGRFWA
jgi:hypothetical protein